ncbi:hypothetical protein EKH55_4772 [Sinorhizobium alkalisoli]|nr:hypothetical protein EKH55_4772 [Sinorhizobium alkalisoli]
MGFANALVHSGWRLRPCRAAPGKVLQIDHRSTLAELRQILKRSNAVTSSLHRRVGFISPVDLRSQELQFLDELVFVDFCLKGFRGDGRVHGLPEDGKKLKSLKRRLTAKYGLTPEQYRQKC